MKRLMTGTMIVLAMAAFSGSAMADKLPKGSVKLKAAEVKAIYSGKTANWKKSKGYFAPDGTLFIVANNSEYASKGTWSVSGNKFCSKSKWVEIKSGKTGTYSDCTTWFSDGKKYWSLWSKEKDRQEGYFDGEMKKLKAGDRVTASYKKLMAKVGK